MHDVVALHDDIVLHLSSLRVYGRVRVCVHVWYECGVRELCTSKVVSDKKKSSCVSLKKIYGRGRVVGGRKSCARSNSGFICMMNCTAVFIGLGQISYVNLLEIRTHGK